MGLERWGFPAVVGVVYLLVWLVDGAAFSRAVGSLASVLERIVPVFILVFLIMVLANKFLSPKRMMRHVGKEAGLRGWLIAIAGGILSTGPIFVWYPLLKGLKGKGMRDGYVAAFLYNRAVKPALLPLLVAYFGLTYTVVLTVVMVGASVVQGLAVERLAS